MIESKSVPFIVEFSGMPKSGKTTIIEIVSQYFRRLGFTVKVHADNGTYSNVSKDNIGALNLQLAAQATSYIIESYYSRYSQADIILIDRGIFDRCVFARVLNDQQKITGSECHNTINFLLSDTIKRTVRCVFAFITSAEKSLEREHQHSLTSKHGEVMNHAFLDDFRRCTNVLASELFSHFDQVRIVDTDLLDGSVRETAKSVVLDILQKLPQSKLQEIGEKIDVIQQDEFMLLASETNDELPYVIHKEGKYWHRYMDRLYLSRPIDEWSEQDGLLVCDVRLDHLEDLTDLELNNEICKIVASTLNDSFAPARCGSLLDFGCGSGLSIELLQRNLGEEIEIVGADLSEKAVGRARNAGHNVLLVGENGFIPEEERKFDAITAIYVMHLNVSEEALINLNRVAKKSAPFVFNLYEKDVSSLRQRFLNAGWSIPEKVTSSKRYRHHSVFVSRSVT